MTHYIDYSDHYAHSDANIGPYNFLQFSEKQWRLYNPGIHYQNRMRHADYGRLFNTAGFAKRRVQSITPPGCERFLSSLDLGPEFRGRPREEILPVHGQYVVQPA